MTRPRQSVEIKAHIGDRVDEWCMVVDAALTGKIIMSIINYKMYGGYHKNASY